MSISTQILLNKYQSYMSQLVKYIKRNPENECFKFLYRDYAREYSNLLASQFEPRITDEVYQSLSIY